MNKTRTMFSVLMMAAMLCLAPAGAAKEQIDEPPEPISQPSPVYPMQMRMAGLEGRVTIDYIVTADGRVAAAQVVRSNNPWFERPALDAVMKWRFKPGRKNGRAVNTRVRQEFPFTLTDGGAQMWSVSKTADQSSLPPALQWDIAPVPVNTTFPVYPFADLESAKKGKTKILLVVGTDGRVVSADIKEATTPEMGLAALAMIDAWEFKPARKKDGSLAGAVLAMEHEFNINGGDAPVSKSAHGILATLRRSPAKIAKLSDLDEPVKPLSQRAPIFPSALNGKIDKGEAEIEFFIDEAGDAQLPRIVSASAPEFGYAAVQAVATWRFTPPESKGKPVVVRARIPIDFSQKAEAEEEPSGDSEGKP